MPAQLPHAFVGQEKAWEAAADERLTLALHAEEVTVSKRVRRTLVRAATTTSTRDEVVASDLERVQVVVDRFAIGRVVDAAPPLRVEGDVTIMSVVEEELVLVRRLILKEEVHFRTVRSVTRHSEKVTLRRQDVEVTRTLLAD